MFGEGCAEDEVAQLHAHTYIDIHIHTYKQTKNTKKMACHIFCPKKKVCLSASARPFRNIVYIEKEICIVIGDSILTYLRGSLVVVQDRPKIIGGPGRNKSGGHK